MNAIYLFGGVIPNAFANSYQVVKTIEALNALGVRTTLFSQSAQAANVVHEAYGVSGILPITSFPESNHVVLNARMMRVLWQKRRDVQVVCLRETLFVFAALFARFCLRKKVVFEAHRYSSRSFADRIRRYALLHVVHGFVVISRGLQGQFMQKTRKPVVLAFCGVDPHRFDILSDKNAARMRLDLPSTNRIVMYAGSLQAYEGVPFLARAFSRVLDADIRLVILGGTKEQQTVLQKTNPDSRIIWRERVSFGHVPEYLMAADVLAIPLEKDELGASPVKMFEYLFAKKPIVATATSPIREVLHDGENAYLFAVRDEEAFGAALKKAFSEESSRVATSALQESGRYTFSKRAECIKDLLEKIS